MTNRTITVVGSGNGALAVAFDFASHGHEVRLVDLPAFPEQVAAVATTGGIHATGSIEGLPPSPMPDITLRPRWTGPRWSCS